MDTSHWHRKTSLLLLSLNVEHMLHADTNGPKSRASRGTGDTSPASRTVNVLHTKNRNAAVGGEKRFPRYGREVFADGD
jgi:hypothetical protein